MPEKPTQQNIEKQNTDQSNTDSIPFRAAAPPEPKRTEPSPAERMEGYRALIRDNIQYPLLAAQNPEDTDLLDEIVALMTETVCTRRKTTRVCGSDFPAEVVKSRLLKLDAEHIRFVLKCLRENTAKVKNNKMRRLGYSAQEIAALYGVRPNVVAAWVSRARQMLKSEYTMTAGAECIKTGADRSAPVL